jgi:GNAT superfamily N-acetyltransferase
MIAIRDMNATDAEPMSAAFSAQGWHKSVTQFTTYWQESAAGKRTVLLAHATGDFAGYLTIVWESDYPPFHAQGIPEIVDFNVLIKYQRRGVGTTLMDEAERRIAQRSDKAGIGVGLLPDYGKAQILYVRRGYVPDGRGLFAHGRWPQHGDTLQIDDNVALYFTKKLLSA